MGVSFELWTKPRWARTTGGTDETTDVTQPNSQQRNEGWLSTDTPVRSWWNWMWRETYKGLDYLESWVAEMFPANTLPRSQAALGSAFGATAGSQQVSIAAGVAVIGGKRYEYPTQIVSCPTQNTQAVMHRIIVASVSGGLPVLERVDGPSSGVDPTLDADQVPLWRCTQATGSATVTLDEDLRGWGQLVGLDRVDGDAEFKIVNCRTGSGATETRRIKRKIIPGSAFIVAAGSPTKDESGITLTTSSDVAWAPHVTDFPPGARLYRYHVAVTTPNTTNGFTVDFWRRSYTDGSSLGGHSTLDATDHAATTWTESTNDLDALGLGEIDQDSYLAIKLSAGANHDCTIHAVIIEYFDDYALMGHDSIL